MTKNEDKLKVTEKWEKESLIDISWENIFIKPFKTTNDPKLRWLQYRLLHRILPVNTYFIKMKIVDCNLCTFCNTEPESIAHLFWECKESQTFWRKLSANHCKLSTCK